MQPTSNGISHLDFGTQHEARLYRLLVKELPEYAIFFVNPDGRTATWNAGVEQILGYTEAEFLDRPFSILFTAEDRVAGVSERELINAQCGVCADDVGLDDAQAVFRGELPRAHFEKRYVAKNGAVVPRTICRLRCGTSEQPRNC